MKNRKIKINQEKIEIKEVYDLSKQLIPYLFNKKQKAIKLRDYCEFLINDNNRGDNAIKN